MPFPTVPASTPAAIGSFVFTANSTIAPDGSRALAVSYRVQVLDANGNEVEILAGDLDPELTATQRTALGTLMDAMVTKATAEAIPTV